MSHLNGSVAAARFLGLVAIIAVLGAGATRLYKDTSLDAFVPDDSPALTVRDHVRERFRLTEPIAVAYIGESAGAALRPASLMELREATELIKTVPGVDPDQVISLSTRSWVDAAGDGLEVALLLPAGPITDATGAQVLKAVAAAPSYRGVLISDDAASAMIVAEIRHGAKAGEVYQSISTLLRARELPPGMTLHIAGQATISGYLSQFIDQDTRVIVPAAVLLSLIIMVVLLRSVAALAVGAFVLLGTLAATLGLMGWLGKPLFVITSSLPVVLVCASIADAIHLLSRARTLRQQQHMAAAAAILQARQELFRPMALTSLTTAFGFLGLTLGSQIPALQQYGLFAAFGVVFAWGLTLMGAPWIYVKLSKASPAPSKSSTRSPSRRLHALGAAAGRWPRALLVAALGLVLLGAWGFERMSFNYERVRNFGEQSNVYRANAAINTHFDGSYFLDVYLRSDTRALTDPEVLTAVADLQAWMRGPAGGLVDALSYWDLINEVRTAADPVAAGTPLASRDDAEQWLFLFEVSAQPGELAQRLSTDRSEAYIRGYLRTDNFQQVAPLVTQLQLEAVRRLEPLGVVAQVTGPVLVTTSWVGPLYGNTLWGIASAMLLVGLCSAALFRSIKLGLLCLLPVSVAVLFVFGIMGAAGIWLDVVTSMFATICIGLGVDFSIHVIHALEEIREEGFRGPALSAELYERIGAPLAFNAASLAGGMLITLLSAIPPVGYFGLLTAVAVISAFVATLLIVPPLFLLREASSSADTAPATGQVQG